MKTCGKCPAFIPADCWCSKYERRTSAFRIACDPQVMATVVEAPKPDKPKKPPAKMGRPIQELEKDKLKKLVEVYRETGSVSQAAKAIHIGWGRARASLERAGIVVK